MLYLGGGRRSYSKPFSISACGRHRHFESMGESEKISTWEQERQKKPRSHWSSLSIRKMGEVADGKMNEVNEGWI